MSRGDSLPQTGKSYANRRFSPATKYNCLQGKKALQIPNNAEKRAAGKSVFTKTELKRDRQI